MVSCRNLRWPKNDVRLQINKLNVIQSCSVRTVKLSINNDVNEVLAASSQLSPQVNNSVCPISSRTRRNVVGNYEYVSIPIIPRIKKKPSAEKSKNSLVMGSQQKSPIKGSPERQHGCLANDVEGTPDNEIVVKNRFGMPLTPQTPDSVATFTGNELDLDNDTEIKFTAQYGPLVEERELNGTPDINQNLSLGVNMNSAMVLLQQKDEEIAQLTREKDVEIESLKLEIKKLKAETADLKRKLEAFKLDWSDEVFAGNETGPQTCAKSDSSLPPMRRRLRTQSETQCDSIENSVKNNRNKRKVVFVQQEEATSETAPQEHIIHVTSTLENTGRVSERNMISGEPKCALNEFDELFQPEQLENHSENDSGVEVDARCDSRNGPRKLRNRKRQKSSMSPDPCQTHSPSFAVNETKSISSSHTVSPIPPRREIKSCKYGKFCVDKSRNEGVCKVGFAYPQRPDELLTDPSAEPPDELNHAFKPEELALLPMYGQFRIKEIPSLNISLVPKNFTSDMTVKKCQERHESHEGQEKLRKKWADSRDRQIEMHENLMKRQKSCSNLDHLTVPHCDRSFARDPEGITDVEVSNDVPVSAFGANVPYVESRSFSLEWFNVKKYNLPKWR